MLIKYKIRKQDLKPGQIAKREKAFAAKPDKLSFIPRPHIEVRRRELTYKETHTHTHARTHARTHRQRHRKTETERQA